MFSRLWKRNHVITPVMLKNGSNVPFRSHWVGTGCTTLSGTESLCITSSPKYCSKNMPFLDDPLWKLCSSISTDWSLLLLSCLSSLCFTHKNVVDPWLKTIRGHGDHYIAPSIKQVVVYILLTIALRCSIKLGAEIPACIFRYKRYSRTSTCSS